MAKKGYYTLEDGSKSTDPENAELLKVKKKKNKKLASMTAGDDDEVIKPVKKNNRAPKKVQP